MLPQLICSTCDGYEFVDGDEPGVKVDCPDCRAPRIAARLTAVRCPVHGCPCPDGRCPRCGREAAVALERIERRGSEMELAV